MEKLLDELEAVLAEVPDSTRAALVSAGALDGLKAEAKLESLERLGRFADRLHAMHRIPGLGQMRRLANSAARFDERDVAIWLVRRALAIGARRALEELEAYCGSTHFQANEVVVLDGISVTESLPIQASIKLRPVTELDVSWFSEQFGTAEGFGSSQRRTALVRSLNHPLEFHNPEEGFGAMDAYQGEELRDVARLMTLLRDVAPVVVAHWWEHAPNVPARIRTSGASAGLGFEYSFHPTLLDTAALDAVGKWLALKEALPNGLWQTLRVVLDRLNAAKRRSGTVDRAIELGVASEALFLTTDGEGSELSFRLATRAAWMLGASHAERIEVFDLFRVVYDARSRAVHRGAVPNQIKGRDVRHALDQACERVAEAVVWTLRNPAADVTHLHLGSAAP